MKIKILLAEDDNDLGQLLRQYLALNGFDATRVFNGREARERLAVEAFDIVVLDVMMPEEDGLTAAEALKQAHPNLPFLFVTARKSREDVLAGLKLGADDYITKPFDADELILRINNILKRTNRAALSSKPVEQLQIGRFSFEPEGLQLKNGEQVQLMTQRESDLLLYLYQRDGQLVKREQILQELWKENDFFKGRSMDVFVTRLRKYLAADPGITIESVRGIGYRFLFPNKF
ncbi:response regulator transcription factor [Mucilaginibacter jinjuensis]|uniref:Response regulator transcription factor n=1 Tax=Mucilaginibacter jinjuensis TaxID=1176721 RepID=A0ABY7TAN2_9SPHI|nr:response regulator transcription factor [Mucilaginibacter jinjuensis]WCT13391.1 response regulator transcription factor [Mucilaginibacter jinjuensis]